MAAAIKWVGHFLSPSKPVAPPSPPQPQSPTPATPPPGERLLHAEYQPIPRSLFSEKPSDYLPGSKRKFELDFESPRTAKKSKMETLATSKHNREIEFETPQRKTKKQAISQTMPRMPRSAMKHQLRPQTPTTTIKKNVTFNQDPLTGARSVRPYFGPSGQYAGSLFTNVTPPPFSSPEASPSTPSTISETGSSQRSVSLSPATKSNTNANTPSARTPGFTDPYDPYWVPRPHNPRPGQFCLPDDLSSYDRADDESMIEEWTTPTIGAGTASNTPATPETIRKGYNAVFPDSPETPQPLHSQLPSNSAKSASAVTSSYPTPQHALTTSSTTESIFADVGADAINRARAAAEKYKPESVGKQASKLSQVTQARSRSTSPPGSSPTTPSFVIDPALVAQDKENSAPPPQQDGTVDYSYQKECDEWARNLDWPEPGQEIVEDEIFKSEMMEQILKEWTKEDDEQSKNFWDREYDRIVDAGRRAKREGKALMFV